MRPSFTLGGSGSSIAYNREEFDDRGPRGLDASPISEVLIEESIIGWKEYEMEVMRDDDDNVVIICSIENFDPMGVHTGDSITVAPAQTLTDKEYQRMRDASIAVIREIGVETGGSNIQFAIDPQDGPDDRDRDEPARQPLQRPGLEGHRLSHRQDRRQAGRRLSAARVAQRHHARNDGLLRADDRLRGDQDSALRLREIPRGRLAAHHADEKRRRDDGHRADVQGVVPKGAARAGSRQLRLRLRRQGSLGHAEAALARRNSRQARHAQRRSRLVHPLCHQIRHVGRGNPRADATSTPGFWTKSARDRRSGRRAARLRRAGRASSDELLRRAKQFGFSDRQLATIWNMLGNGRPHDAQAPRHRGHVQIGRHLRRRVRSLHALLLFDLRRRGRNAAQASPAAGGS